jgi:uncharacterized protein YaeQ
MALKSTIFKASLQVSDLDRHYYQDHALTIARHPSETDERMMVRVLAFARHASEALVFGKGLSAEDEADLSESDLTGAMQLWVEVGLPEEKQLRRACGRATQVVVYAYGGNAADLWWKKNQSDLERIRNLTVINVPLESSRALAVLAERTMELRCMIQEGHMWLSDENREVEIDVETVKAMADGRN